jgi:50S ribosomal subunit-associated GTPase HflX
LKILIADSSLHVDSLDANSDLQSFSRQLLSHRDDNSRTRNFSELGATDVFDRDSTIVVMNKTDLLPSESTDRRAELENVPICWMSCKTGDGVDTFMDSMKRLLETM